MFMLIKRMFIGLFTSTGNTSNHIICVFFSNLKCMIQTTVINFHPSEYSQELHYYPFAIKLGRCVDSYNTLNDLSNKVCVPKKQNIKI